MVVDRDGEDLLGFVLADDVLVEERADLAWRRQLLEPELAGLGEVFFDQGRPAVAEAVLRGVENSPEGDAEKIRLRELGFIFQTFCLIPTLSALENTTYFLPMLGFSKKEAEQLAAKEALKTLRNNI